MQDRFGSLMDIDKLIPAVERLCQVHVLVL